MANKSISLKIGSLIFGKKSISYILFGFFLVGILVGTYSIIHIENSTLSDSITIPLLFAGLVVPVIIISKGIRKATDLSKE